MRRAPLAALGFSSGCGSGYDHSPGALDVVNP